MEAPAGEVICPAGIEHSCSDIGANLHTGPGEVLSEVSIRALSDALIAVSVKIGVLGADGDTRIGAFVGEGQGGVGAGVDAGESVIISEVAL